MKKTDVSINELTKAVETLEKGIVFSQRVQNDSEQFLIARDACIQRFEYCIEVAWKVAMKKLGSQTKFAKPAIREMARADLIASAEEWLTFIDARNESSHSYDEKVAQRVYSTILKFLAQAKVLITNLNSMS